MTPIASSCFVCDGADFDHMTGPYRRCQRCGHETLVQHATQSFMLNDALSPRTIARDSFLDYFQTAVLEHHLAGRRRGQLVDIGCGSGKFLSRNGHKFERHCGVEVTPAAVEFCRTTLGLNIVSDLAAVDGEIDVATAWHSLEHFPRPALESLLRGLGAKLAANACVIVSVPNAASFQYRIFRSHYAFFDVPAHLHQFTPDSLLRLFRVHGFECRASSISWPYNVFGYVQALLNCVTPEHNYLYYRLKRGHPRVSAGRDLSSFALLAAAAPLGFGCSLVDAVLPARQAVLTYCFEKRG